MMRGSAALGSALLLSAAVVSAQPAAPVASRSLLTVSAPASAGQRTLTVGFARLREEPTLVARTCAATPCDLKGAVALPLALPRDADIGRSRLTVLPIGLGRKIVHVEVGTGATHWQALIAAPADGTAVPRVIWSGLTPDEPPVGVESVGAIQIAPPAKDGTVTVLVGEIRPSMQICGRRSLLAPQVVHARDLTLRHVKMQRLSATERGAAPRLNAVADTDPTPEPLARLLVATGASSATGDGPGALTDGNPDTVWSEARGAEGRGEFLVMKAAREVPIRALSLVVRPPKAEVEHGAAPRDFFLASDDRLFRIELPADAWDKPGVRYRITFDSPLATSCLSIVLDDATLPSKAPKDARVSLAEVSALSVFDGVETHETLAKALSGPADKAEAAAALLLRGGPPAHVAVAKQYGALDPNGRMRAMSVLDAAGCSLSPKVYASYLASPSDLEAKHAKDRVQRCGRASAGVLASVFLDGPGCSRDFPDAPLCERARAPQRRGSYEPGRLAALNELASIAPDRAVRIIAPRIAKGNVPTRRTLRGYLARAGRRERGREALAHFLGGDRLSAVGLLDVLRGSSEQFEALRSPAGLAFSRLATPDADLRMRYLLLVPAAKLASLGDVRGTAFLRKSIQSDPEPMVRTLAIELSSGLEAVRPWVTRALEDPNVRVRDAAAQSLAGSTKAAPYLARRLLIDEWPMVRAHAAGSLATAGASEEVDRALGQRLRDDSPKVRIAVATALGTRGARAFAPALREVADAEHEKVLVRSAALRALGQMCDPEAADLMTTFAQRAVDPYSPEAVSGLGQAAIAALGRLHPSDLQKRLAPLLGAESSSPQVRAAAMAAMNETDVCGKR